MRSGAVGCVLLRSVPRSIRRRTGAMERKDGVATGVLTKGMRGYNAETDVRVPRRDAVRRIRLKRDL